MNEYSTNRITYPEIPQFRECVHNDTKNNVEQDCCKDDEERCLENHPVAKIFKIIVQWMKGELLKSN